MHFQEKNCSKCNSPYVSGIGDKGMCQCCEKNEYEKGENEFIAEILGNNCNLVLSLVKLAKKIYELQNRKPVYVPPPIYG